MLSCCDDVRLVPLIGAQLRISSWFIASSPGHPLVMGWLKSLRAELCKTTALQLQIWVRGGRIARDSKALEHQVVALQTHHTSLDKLREIGKNVEICL